jgi:putative transposase
MLVSIPPKYSVAQVVGYMKGKSAIWVARLVGRERNVLGQNFWARGYCVSTIGLDERTIQEYIQAQEEADFRRAFQRACKRAVIKGLCFHDLRHTAITNMRKAGVDTSVIMAISGHKTMAMFRRYNRVDLDDGRDAMRKLEAYLVGNQAKEKERIDFILTSSLQNGNLARA